MEAEKKSMLLIADDSPECIDIMRQILTHEYRLKIALSGEKVFSLCQGDDLPELILLDLVMPGMNGYEICQRLKESERTRNIPVIFVTGQDAEQNETAGLAAGAVDYITKPVSPSIVLARVRTQVKIHRQNRELQKAYEGLKRLEELRDGLVHMIVHDLRNPLVGIQGFLDLMKVSIKRQNWDKVLYYADKPLESVAKINNMVDELLDISRMEANAMPVNEVSCDLAGMIHETLTLQGAKEGKILFDLPQSPVRVRCDIDLISRVVANLVNNALKYSSSNETVMVTVAEAHNHARVCVLDRGPGIPQEHRARIFDRFFQVEMRKQGKASSSGLGLTFCRLAIERHQGLIGVEARDGGGSCFWFELPLINEEKPDAGE